MQKSSNLQLEQQEDYLYPYVHFVSNFDESIDYDEEEGDVILDPFRRHIADNSIQKVSSFPLGFYPDGPICDEYSNGKKGFKVYEGLLTNGI